jgi:methylenetetrahydrofolate reductase (NADPH)
MQNTLSLLPKREMGIMVPIIPGIKPLAVQRHLQILPQIFRIDLPEDLIQAVEDVRQTLI